MRMLTPAGATTRICCVSTAPGLTTGFDMGSICNCCDYLQSNVLACLELCIFQKKVQDHTFGTAAWKLRPVADSPPDTWKRAKIITTPGLAADVCGVSVILMSFLS